LWHHDLVEKAAELDDDHLMEKYLEDENRSPIDEIKAALRKGRSPAKVQPGVLRLGSQEHRRAASDRRRDRLPAQPARGAGSPGHGPEGRRQALTRPHDEDAPVLGAGVQGRADAHGDLTYIRIYSGKLTKGSRVLNPNNNKKENVSRIFEMHAKERIALDRRRPATSWR
jgi:elongation factor G